MKLIAISTEPLMPEEAKAINRLFASGLPILHLRKPHASLPETEALLSKIHPEYYNRIVLHDHFELATTFPVKGIHLNKRNSTPPQGMKFSHISRSCHSLKELEDASNYSYVFLSPVFDSISKAGYRQAFGKEQLAGAKEKGVITGKAIALGGISAKNIPTVASYGFGGVAVLGALWGDYLQSRDDAALLKRLNELKAICERI